MRESAYSKRDIITRMHRPIFVTTLKSGMLNEFVFHKSTVAPQGGNIDPGCCFRVKK